MNVHLGGEIKISENKRALEREKISGLKWHFANKR